MRTLFAVLLLLAVFGSSTQCMADCLTQPSVPSNQPPCHKHTQSKTCDHVQVAHPEAMSPPVDQAMVLAETAFEFFTPEATLPDSAQYTFNVLRL